MKSLRLVLSFCILLIPAAAFAADQPKLFQLEDLRRLVGVSDPQISPDGKRVVVIVSHPNWDDDKNDKEIDLVDVDTGAVRPLTYKRTGLDSPRWSPNGDRLAFLAEDPDTKQAQIFVMSMEGGDPVRLTDGKQGVASFTWSPEGKRIAYYVQDEEDEDAAKHHQDVMQVTDNNYLVREPVKPWHVWVVDAAGGKAKRLTEGSWSVQTDQDTGTPLVWAKGGTAIVYAKFPDSYFGNSYLSTIESVGADGASGQLLVDEAGAVYPQYSPSGKLLAFMRPRDGDQNNGNAVYLKTVTGSRDLTHALAHNVDDYLWLPDNSGLLLEGADSTDSVLWRQPLQGPAVKLDLGGVAPRGFSLSRKGALAFTGMTADHPAELYVMDSLKAKPKRLTHFNDFVDGLALGRSVGVDWKSEDGFAEDGVLTYPAGYEQGRKYPLVLVIHGGPEGQSTLGFTPLVQLLAAKDFLVFQPNYRGSTNLGDAYQHAIYRDTGEGPGKDVMAGLAAVLKLGVADESRIAISGWSYGGYMTSWLNGRYPDRWKAALEGAALNDWLMDYEISYYQHGDLYFFGGSPNGPDPATAKLWREQSPIAFAGAVKAPTLILGDAGDNNVPIVNSYEMYHALQDHGVTVEFYVYPVNTHFPGDVVHTTDVYDRWVKWMKKYLK
ncbi:MAG: prolyl oligopeptidase family serine peptidase [Bacillota bacterium]